MLKKWAMMAPLLLASATLSVAPARAAVVVPGVTAGFLGMGTAELAALLVATATILESAKVINIVDDTPDSP